MCMRTCAGMCVSGLPSCIREEEDTCVCVHVLACVFQVFPLYK
jgi:hypothetical protein